MEPTVAMDPLSSALDLFRRLPPQNIQSNLASMVELLPELADDLLSSVDQPLGVQTDETGREYLVCDYNRDGDSYRSPWTNTYSPSLPDGTEPSPKLRDLEIAMNSAFDVYREMYYEGGVASVFLWDLEDGFAGVVLLKKSNEASGAVSTWDSVHVFESSERGRTALYKLTSTVMLYMSKTITSTSSAPPPSSTQIQSGEVSLGGSMTRQHEVEAPHDPSTPANYISSHITNIGKLIEDMESKMRGLLGEVYFSKTKDIVNGLRSSVGYAEDSKRNLLQGELVGLLRGKAATA